MNRPVDGTDVVEAKLFEKRLGYSHVPEHALGARRPFLKRRGQPICKPRRRIRDVFKRCFATKTASRSWGGAIGISFLFRITISRLVRRPALFIAP